MEKGKGPHDPFSDTARLEHMQSTYATNERNIGHLRNRETEHDTYQANQLRSRNQNLKRQIEDLQKTLPKRSPT